MVATLSVAISLAIAPVAHAQDASPTPTPFAAPSFVGDAQLVALFPATIAGEALQTQSINGNELASVANAEAIAQLTAGLTLIGKTLDDLSLGFGSYSNGAINAVRIKGVDAATVAPQLLPLILNDMAEPVQTAATEAGKSVIRVTDGPDSPEANARYIYLHDDIIWDVEAPEPDLTEIFQNLP